MYRLGKSRRIHVSVDMRLYKQIPRLTEKNGQPLHIGHADPRLFVDDVAAQVFHRNFQLAVRTKRQEAK